MLILNMVVVKFFFNIMDNLYNTTLANYSFVIGCGYIKMSDQKTKTY